MPDPQIPLCPEGHYHLYNHAVGKENLFLNESDYAQFLALFKKYITPVADLMAYCLMPNHFHLLVRIKSVGLIKDCLQTLSARPLDFDKMKTQNHYFIEDKLSRIFANFFNAYAKRYNNANNRTGTLFKRAFRRKEIKEMKYLQQLVCYIHQNPVEAGFANQPAGWKYSSYTAILSANQTMIPKDDVIELFGSRENFIYCNGRLVEIEDI